jgi:hypothetical protein
MMSNNFICIYICALCILFSVNSANSAYVKGTHKKSFNENVAESSEVKMIPLEKFDSYEKLSEYLKSLSIYYSMMGRPR